jgi:hypothetical protein
LNSTPDRAARIPGRIFQWLLPASLAAFVIARCAILSGKRLLWADELFSWYPASASFGSMLRATTDTINTAPPLYFVLTWLWAAVFGNSALSLRLFSAAAVAAAILIMFAVLRRAYGVLASTLAIGMTLIGGEMLRQSAEARFHTLFVAEVALGILLYQRLVARPRPPMRLLALNAAAHACMMMTTYIAAPYSLAIFCATLLTGLVRRRNPTRACLSIAAGWLVFLPWIPVFLRHLRMGEPSSWVPVPNATQLRHYFEGYLANDFFWPCAAGLAALAAIGTAFAMVWGGRRRRLGPQMREVPLLMLAPCLAAIPLLIYFWSILPGRSSLFLERYMLATLLGWTILCAHLAHRALLLRHRIERRWPTRALLILQVITTIAFLGHGIWKKTNAVLRVEKKGLPDDVLERIPGNEPIVIGHIHQFLQWHFYSSQPSRLLFMVDLELAIQEGEGEPLNHRIMAALHRQFPDQFKEVMETDDFLASASTFWVRPSDPWTPVRLENNPAFVVEPVDWDLMHVRRTR